MQRRSFVLGGLASVTVSLRGSAAGHADAASVPLSGLYSDETRERWGAWGPPARQLPASAGASDDSAALARRVTAVARRHVGLGYQHHHLPEFDPPVGWPWLPVSVGRNGPGLDCSNFTSLVFNQALGIKLPTAIGTQANSTTVAGPGGHGSAALTRIEPSSYDDAVARLRAADLLYIRSDAGRVSHVVIWLGAIRGISSFIDCTDAVRSGTGGARIPTGVRIRPFLPDSWYGRRFAYAHRLNGLGTGSGPAPAFVDGGDL